MLMASHGFTRGRSSPQPRRLAIPLLVGVSARGRHWKLRWDGDATCDPPKASLLMGCSSSEWMVDESNDDQFQWWLSMTNAGCWWCTSIEWVNQLTMGVTVPKDNGSSTACYNGGCSVVTHLGIPSAAQVEHPKRTRVRPTAPHGSWNFGIAGGEQQETVVVQWWIMSY